MPNTFALVVLWAWPVFCVLAFRRLPLATGLSLAMIGGYLLVPPAISVNLPLLPPYEKRLAAGIAGLLLVMMAPRPSPRMAQVAPATSLPGWLPASLALRLCLLLLVVGALGTTMTNSEPMRLADRALPGMTLKDAMAMILGSLGTILPFLLARKYIAATEDQERMIRVLVFAALAYTLLALFEVRMSPQLNRMVYGFFPHSWLQHIRGDGYRPVVFLQHGLWLAIFFTSALVATLGYARVSDGGQKVRLLAAAAWIFATQAVSKSLGALVLSILFAPIALIFGRRVQLVFVAAITLAVLGYPMLRGSGLVAVDQIAAVTEQIDADRAKSFNGRLRNENMLLERVSEKPLFGWGEWGRWRVYDERGIDRTTSDGFWIITLSQGGWARYLAMFGLLCLPVLQLAFRRRHLDDPKAQGLAIALALALTANLIDLLPNAGITPLTWMLAGALAGRMELQPAAAAQHAPGPPATPRSPYTPVRKATSAWQPQRKT